MYNILMVVTMNGFGEANIATSFASQLDPSRYNVFFICPKHATQYIEDTFQHYELKPDKRSNNTVIKNLIMSMHPNLLIYSTYAESQLDSYIDNDILENSIKNKATLVADYMDPNLTEIYEMPKNKAKKLNPIPKNFAIIRPIPIGKEFNSHKTYHYRPYGSFFGFSENKQERIKENLKCPPDYKLVLYSSPKWIQYICLTNGMKKVYRGIGDCILKALVNSNQKIFLCHIADYPLIEPGTYKNVTVINKSSMRIKDYNDLASSSDLILTTNSTSGGIFGAIFNHVPAIAFTNSYTREEFNKQNLTIKSYFEPLDNGIDPIYPWKVFPIGNIETANIVWSNKTLKAALIETEIFNISKSAKLIENILSDNNLLNETIKENQEHAISIMMDQDSAEEVVLSIIRNT